jgi:hypothetical protein
MPLLSKESQILVEVVAERSVELSRLPPEADRWAIGGFLSMAWKWSSKKI